MHFKSCASSEEDSENPRLVVIVLKARISPTYIPRENKIRNWGSTEICLIITGKMISNIKNQALDATVVNVR